MVSLTHKQRVLAHCEAQARAAAAPSPDHPSHDRDRADRHHGDQHPSAGSGEVTRRHGTQPNTIQGVHCIDGIRIKFDATRDPAIGVWDIRVLDHHGELTRDVAGEIDPMELWGAIAELVEAAVETSRAALREMAGVE